MALWADFVGGFYTARSTSLATEAAINVYAETREGPGGAKQTTLYGTPGLTLESTLTTTGCRGWFSENGRTWVVVGTTLSERTVVAGMVLYTAVTGTIPDDGLNVSYASNGTGGNQLAIVGGGTLHVVNLLTNLMTAVTLPFADPVMIVFQDGYGLINQANTPTVWFSSVEDFTVWDALDFFARSGTSDNLVGLGVSQDRVRAFGSATTTDFYDSGDIDTPFVPYPGTTAQTGLVAPTLVTVYRDVFYWVADAARGQYRVVAGTTTQAQVISTHPIDLFLSRCATLADAELLAYEQEGHTFIAITCPSSPDDIKTYVFDPTESASPWHARAGWDTTTGTYTRWRAKGSVVVNNTVLVGDYQTGNVYTLDLDTYDDNGAPLVRERRTPYVSADNQWVFIDQFELGMQPGVGLSAGQGSAPVVELQISRDSAHSWVSAGVATLGAMGEYAARAIWRRLGRARSDRLVFKVIQTDPVPCVWGPGAWLSLTPGTGQL